MITDFMPQSPKADAMHTQNKVGYLGTFSSTASEWKLHELKTTSLSNTILVKHKDGSNCCWPLPDSSLSQHQKDKPSSGSIEQPSQKGGSFGSPGLTHSIWAGEMNKATRGYFSISDSASYLLVGNVALHIPRTTLMTWRISGSSVVLVLQ